MALVIFFVPQPEKGVAEMARVVKPGGLVSSYAWDMDGGGFPMEPFRAQMRAMGLKPMGPPREDASRIDVLRELWSGAGLLDLETKEITVHRTFTDFEEYWGLTVKGSSSLGPMIAKMTPGEGPSQRRRARKAHRGCRRTHHRRGSRQRDQGSRAEVIRRAIFSSAPQSPRPSAREFARPRARSVRGTFVLASTACAASAGSPRIRRAARAQRSD